MTQIKFWESFKSQNFASAQDHYEQLSSDEKVEILSKLYQESQNCQTPFMISVLRRKLHEDKSFDQFYKAWHPAAEHCHEIECGGQTFQQVFPSPVRVFNATKLDDNHDIISIGLIWARDETDKQKLYSYLDQSSDKVNDERHDKIKQKADGELVGIFEVKSDDNLGTPF